MSESGEAGWGVLDYARYHNVRAGAQLGWNLIISVDRDNTVRSQFQYPGDHLTAIYNPRKRGLGKPSFKT